MTTTNVCKIKIRAFGPIQEGTQGNFIDIRKCTLFIGQQGSGKSSVAKLISEFSWLEKALVRGDVTEKDVVRKNRFKDFYCDYHRLSSYFRPETEIYYEGEYYCFAYEAEQFRVEKREADLFDLPKILYVPAERNMVGIMEKSGTVKYFPESLRTFWEEYEDARLAVKGELTLPVDGMAFTYDRLNKISWIKGESYHTRLSESASGYQSLVPLFLVSRHLSELTLKDSSNQEMDPDLYSKLQRDVATIMTNPELTEEVRAAALKTLSSRFRYSHFVNIVEEPELNLYPVSQRNLLYSLIQITNSLVGNKLVFTTHSPYMLSALNNLLYASQVGAKNKEEVERILPSSYWISPLQVSAYTTDGGTIVSIMDDDLQQVEAERIDGISSELNEQYEQLLDLEEDLE